MGATSSKREKARRNPAEEARVRHRTMQVGAVEVFYREAGSITAPPLLLLHGWPTSSHTFRHLLPLLAPHFRVIAPDMPGFGFTKAPPRGRFDYRFQTLAETMRGFVDGLGLERFALYLFDYGAPVGFSLALDQPDRIAALVVQNGNAYEEGLTAAWDPIKAYWRDPSIANREALRGALSPEGLHFAYLTGVPDPTLVSPDAWLHDQVFLDRPGAHDIQLDLFLDYRANVARYPAVQAYLRQRQPPLLTLWGRNDPYFTVAGAEAYARDVTATQTHWFETGHFALETHAAEIAALTIDFLGRHAHAATSPPARGRAADPR